MEADRGGARAQWGETVLFAEQCLGTLRGVPFAQGAERARAQRWAGTGPGARPARRQLPQQLGELAPQDVDPAGGAGGVLGGEA